MATTRETMTEKFLNSVMVTLIARATLVAMPFVVTFITYITMQVYGSITASLQTQGQQIIEIQRELQEHQFRLDTGKAARIELQENAMKQFANIDSHLDAITDRVSKISETVIRVQTIVETRLPPKEGLLKLNRTN